jgi:hypothetical protein
VLLVDGTPSVPSGDGMVAFIQLPTDPSNTAPVVGGGSAMTVRVKVFTGANYAAANSGDYRLVLQVDCGALQPTVAMAVPGLCAGGGDTTTRTVAYAFKAKAAGAAIVVPAADQEMLLGGLPATALHIFVETADGAHWSNYLQPTTSLMFEDAKDGAAVADHVDSEAWTPVILVDLADPTSSSPAEPAADGAEAMDWTDTVLEGLGLGWLFDLL